MTLLVTGGTGFVMSVVARTWLDSDKTTRAVILDRSGLDGMAERFFAPVRDRLTVITGDICDPTQWADALDKHNITKVVHGATVTPISRGTAALEKREPEAQEPEKIVNVNLMGTVHLLEWVRQSKTVERTIYVSSGSVYRHHGPDWHGEPLPEDGYVAPLTLYGISKFAAEMVVNRYADLFGLSAIAVRLSSIYGPMDRATESRNFRHVPNRVAHMALAGELIRPNSLESVGDYLSSSEVARAVIALLTASKLHYRHYNIANGSTATMQDVISWAAEKVPGVRFEVSPDDRANVTQDPAFKTGMWGAYDIARILRDTDWRPRPEKELFHEYMDWISSFEQGAAAKGRNA